MTTQNRQKSNAKKHKKLTIEKGVDFGELFVAKLEEILVKSGKISLYGSLISYYGNKKNRDTRNTENRKKGRKGDA